MKTIEIPIPDKDYDLLTRIAKDQKRRLSDLHYFIYAEGLGSFFCESDVNIKKHDSELTKEEIKQLAVNEKLQKEKDFWKLEKSVKKEKGYKFVRTHMSNHEYDPDKDGYYSDGLITPLSERIENYGLEGLPNE